MADYIDQTSTAALNNKLDELFASNTAQKTTAEEQAAALNQKTEQSYKERQLQGAQAQNQFAQNQAATQASALDAIRRSNASAIANGANAGLSSANQLSSILGLQEQNVEATTDLANDAITAAAERNTQMAQNAVSGQELANAQNNAAADRDAAIANIIAQLRGNEATVEAARIAAETQQATQASQNETSKEVAKINTEAENLKTDKSISETDYNNILEGLSNYTSTWITGNNRTYASSYIDPYTGKTVKTDDSNSKSADKDNIQQIFDRLASDLRLAYSSGNAEDVAKVQAKIKTFQDSIVTSQDNCITGDTLITMADSTFKAVKDLKGGEEVLSYDPIKGLVITTLYTPLARKAEPRTVLTLHFSNGLAVDIVEGHSFLLVKKNKAVAITLKNVKKYIGKEFRVGFDTKAFLQKTSTYETNEVVYSPMAHKNLWLFTNGILSTAHLTEFIVNARLGKYNQSDLITYEQVPEFIRKDVSKELFDAYDGEMLKVWAKGFRKFFIGKRIKNLIKLLD